MGKCAMVQNGNWGASQILGVAGNTVNKEDIKFMPIYMGIEGEDKLGICVGTENFICINSKASKAEQQAAADFLYWLFSSDEGKNSSPRSLASSPRLTPSARTRPPTTRLQRRSSAG